MKKIPEQFINFISIDEHEKASLYNLEKISFGKIIRTFNLIILLIWTIGGGLNLLGYYTTSEKNTFLETFIFLLSYMTIETFLSVPASFYSTFVIEEKYGFNKTTKKIFFSDLLKSFVISLVISTPLLFGLLHLLNFLGDNWWLFGWLGFMVFQLLLIFIYPTFIAPIFNKFTPLENQELEEKIKVLLSKVNFNAKELFKMDASTRSTHGNAYFTGFGKNKRIVFYDTLLEKMNHDEILAILSHELGHFKKKHILKSLIIGSIALFIVFFLLSLAIKNPIFLSGHGLNNSNNLLAIILFMMVMPVYSFLIGPISNYFSRKNEFEADQFACTYSSAKDLESALLKLYKFNYGPLCTDEIYSAFYDSHPPAKIRINHLKENS